MKLSFSNHKARTRIADKKRAARLHLPNEFNESVGDDRPSDRLSIERNILNSMIKL